MTIAPFANARALQMRPLTAFADPGALPARLTIPREDGGRMVVDVARDHTVVHPATGAGAPTIVTPLRLYKGVAVRVARSGDGAPVFHVELLHGEDERTIPLAVGRSIDAAYEEWRQWARVLDLPLLAIDGAGRVHCALTPLGGVFAERPNPRRGGSPLVGRRTRFARTRATGGAWASVIRGEREMIAPE